MYMYINKNFPTVVKYHFIFVNVMHCITSVSIIEEKENQCLYLLIN